MPVRRSFHERASRSLWNWCPPGLSKEEEQEVTVANRGSIHCVQKQKAAVLGGTSQRICVRCAIQTLIICNVRLKPSKNDNSLPNQ
jgi:hypothetical protein